MSALLFPRRAAALLGMLAAVANAGLRVAIVPLFVTPVFDRVLASRDLAALPGVLLTAAVVVAAGSGALLAQDALMGRAAAQVAADWRERLYRALLGRSPGRLPGSSGGLSSRILTDLKEVEVYYQFGLGSLVAESVTVLGILAVLFYTDALASVFLLAAALPLGLLLGWLGRAIGRVSRDAQAGSEVLGGHLQEGLRHHAVVRAFGAQGFMLRRFSADNRRAAALAARRSLLASLPIPLSQLLVFAALGGLVALLARRVAAGQVSTGEVVSYLTLVALLATPAQLLPRAFALLKQAGAASERLRALLQEETPPTKALATPPAEPQPRALAGLELKNLGFAYAPGEWLLRGLELTLPQRGLVALVGESGSGKTTLLQLLLRFLEPGEGRVLLAGAPLESVGEAELRARVAYVPQSTDLLSGTVRDNLLLGRDYPDEALWQALERLRLAAAVRALPDGLEHALREDGAGLSGGQRQRLAVARALLGEPALLLLDEPSANLDAESEAALVAALCREAEARLVLVVAHRPAIVAAAERVLVLEGGALREAAPLEARGG